MSEPPTLSNHKKRHLRLSESSNNPNNDDQEIKTSDSDTPSDILDSDESEEEIDELDSKRSRTPQPLNEPTRSEGRPGRRSHSKHVTHCKSAGCKAALTHGDMDDRLVHCSYHRDQANASAKRYRLNRNKRQSTDHQDLDHKTQDLDQFRKATANEILADLFRKKQLEVHQEVNVKAHGVNISDQGSEFIRMLGLELGDWGPGITMSVDSLAIEGSSSPYAFVRIYECDCPYATTPVSQAEGACEGKITIMVLDSKHGSQRVIVDISH